MPYKDKEKQKQAQKDHYQENKQDYRNRLKKRRKDNAAFVQTYKCGKSCSRCGESNPLCLEFHHVGDDKEDCVTRGINSGWAIEKLKAEIDKCEVLCANCHRKIHATTPIHHKRISLQWLTEYKKGLSCECGENSVKCLDFHHIDSDNKISSITLLAVKGLLEVLKEEIKKCKVLCANCHRVEHNGCRWSESNRYWIQ